MIQTPYVKSAENSGGKCALGFLEDVWDDESMLLPIGVAVTVEDVEARKEDALG